MHSRLDRTMRRLLIAGGVMLALVTRLRALSAQSPVTASVGAGLAVPSGVLQDEANPGWRALAALDVGLPDMPVSLRIDAAYDRFGYRSTPVGSAGGETGARTIVSGSLSLTLGASDSVSQFSPYAVAGVGMNRIGCTGRSSCDATSQMGWGAGLGARFGLLGRHAFADARFQCVSRLVSDLCYFPLTFGLVFGAHDASAVDRPNGGL